MAYSVVIAGPAERDLDVSEAVAARVRHCMAKGYMTHDAAQIALDYHGGPSRLSYRLAFFWLDAGFDRYEGGVAAGVNVHARR